MTPNNLRDRMNLAGLTPAGLAKRLGISRQAVSKWLRGESKITERTEKQIADLPEFEAPKVRYLVSSQPVTGKPGWHCVMVDGQVACEFAPELTAAATARAAWHCQTMLEKLLNPEVEEMTND